MTRSPLTRGLPSLHRTTQLTRRGRSGLSHGRNRNRHFNTGLGLLFGLVIPFLSTAQTRAEIIYGATTAGQLLRIDSTTGAGTLVGPIGFGIIEALEFTSDGTLLGIANANQLIRINPITGAGVLVGTVTGFQWVESLAFDNGNGTLYASANAGSAAEANRLISINPETGQPTFIATSFFGPSFSDVDGLAVSPAGTILGSHINAPTPSLFGVDSVSGAGTLIGGLSMAVVGLDFASDGTLYGVTIPDIQIGGPSRLVTINPDTGAIQDIGPIGFNSLQSIAISPEPQPGSIVDSYVYHNGWLGGGGPKDTSKSLHLETASPTELTYENLINSVRGINGIGFDVDGLANSGAISASDFVFQMSPTGAFTELDNPPTGWAAAPAPVSVVVTPGSPDQILISWNDNDIANRWLRVTILTNVNTGLTADEVYYVGHLLGESTGPSGGAYTIAFADITPIRNGIGNVVDAGSDLDIDKNGIVAFADISAMRANVGAQLTNVTVAQP